MEHRFGREKIGLCSFISYKNGRTLDAMDLGGEVVLVASAAAMASVLEECIRLCLGRYDGIGNEELRAQSATTRKTDRCVRSARRWNWFKGRNNGRKEDGRWGMRERMAER